MKVDPKNVFKIIILINNSTKINVMTQNIIENVRLIIK